MPWKLKQIFVEITRYPLGRWASPPSQRLSRDFDITAFGQRSIYCKKTQSGLKISSIFLPNSLAMAKDKGKLGSYLPVSIALMVCRDTSSCSANCCCDQSRSARNSRSVFFMPSSSSQLSHTHTIHQLTPDIAMPQCQRQSPITRSSAGPPK